MRWIGTSESPVVRCFRKAGKFRVCIAHSSGSSSGWFDAVFVRDKSKQPSTEALERQWEFPTAGIPYSRAGDRFDPWLRKSEGNEGDGDYEQIPMWSEPVSDTWKTLIGSGPWSDDLEDRDLKTADWGSSAHLARSQAAGFIQAIKERIEFDGQSSIVNSDGRWLIETSAKAQFDELMQKHSELKDWLVALAGPKPDAQSAHEAAFHALNTPTAIYAFCASLLGFLSEIEDYTLIEALQNSFEAAILDTRITDKGRKRPWLKNTGHSRLELRTITLDLDAPREDLQTLWRSGLTIPDLLDAGEWFGPHDLPAPYKVVNDAMESVRLESSVEDAKEQVIQLLREAQDARQWSVPWGARVQLQFGPFVSMRIFEKEGEFSCHFLDERDRYLHVAIGLGNETPRISSVQLLRKPDDGGDVVWNDDAAVSLQLIAAAIVRDFLVVEERDSVFTARSMRGRIAGRNINTIIYLPRVRYNMIKSDQQEENVSVTHKPRHAVSHHLRRVGKASAGQRFLAQRYGVALPEGFTFVRPHERGTETQKERVCIYRSRSASRMIFEEVYTAPEGSRPAWFEFEKDCAKLLANESMEVIHQAAQRDGDGGVDLFAVDKDGNSWVVQCKCWAPHRPVGPDVVRELVGAITSADRGSERSSRGMIITTSTFTSGAASEAITQDFRIVDGATFTHLVQAGKM